MKHNYKYLVLGAFLALSFTACDLDYEPENMLVDEKVYRHERTSEAALMGAYVRLDVLLAGAPQDQNNYQNYGYTYLLGDLGTDNLATRPNTSPFDAIESGEYTSSEHDGILRSIWSWAYNAIDMANNVIVGIQKYGNYAQTVQQQHIAEAKFIRAYCYLQLLTIYGDKALLGNDAGQGVILRTAPYSGYNPDEIQGRNTNAACWNLIISDLTSAIPHLPAQAPAAAERIRANKAVAQALLSRVYLYKGTYTNNQDELGKALDLAEEVLNTAGYSFSHAPSEFQQNLFPSNEPSQSSGYPDPTSRSNELLFFEPSRISTAEFPNGLHNYYQKRSYYVPQEMIDIYDPKDVRRTYLIFPGSTSENKDDKTTRKYSGAGYDDVIFLRLSEVKLAYAELLTRTQNAITDEALTHLNDVRLRAFAQEDKPEPYTTAHFASVDDFLKAILLERRKELCYEGLYRWDIVRTHNLPGDTKMGQLEPARWNMPIPNYEIRISYGKITQNSGYN